MVYGNEVRSNSARVSGLSAGWQSRALRRPRVNASQISSAAAPRFAKDVPAWWIGRDDGSLENAGGTSLAVGKHSAVTTAARDAVATTAEATVFLDPSGRRWRTLVLLSAPV